MRGGLAAPAEHASSGPASRSSAIDPSAPYAAALRRTLPHARIVLDHFHLVMLGNQVVTDVRQRALREHSAAAA